MPGRSERWGLGALRGPHLNTSDVSVVAPAASFFSRTDVFGEHADVERAGGLVLVDVLAVGLITLHEVTLHAAEAAGPFQPDQYRLGNYFAEILARATSTHMLSLYGLHTDAGHLHDTLSYTRMLLLATTPK